MNIIPHLLVAFDPNASCSGGAAALALQPPPRWLWTMPGRSSSSSFDPTQERPTNHTILLATIIIIVATSWLFSMVWAG